MNLRTIKHIIYTVLGLAAVAGLGFLAYVLLFPPTTQDTTQTGRNRIIGRILDLVIRDNGTPGTGTSTDNTATTTLPNGIQPQGNTPAPRLVQLTDFAVVGASIGTFGDTALFYKKDGGDLFEVDLDGKNLVQISNRTILGAFQVVWNPTKDAAALFYLDGDTKQGVILSGTSTATVLPPEVNDFSWSPDGKTLAYLVPNENGSNLVIANADVSRASTVFTTPLVDTTILWVSDNVIAFHTAASRHADGAIFTYNRRTGAFKRIVGPFQGLMGAWSQDGTRLIETHRARGTETKEISLRSASGEILSAFPVLTTPQKCAWIAVEELYCAVPRAPIPAEWPDTYIRGEYHTSDLIALIDLDRKELFEIWNDPNRDFDVTNLLVTPNKDYLMFIDRNNGTLWSWRLNE